MSHLSHQRCKDTTSQRNHFILIELWIISPVPSCCNEMKIWKVITNESLQFGYQQSCLVNTSLKCGIIPATICNLFSFLSTVQRHYIGDEPLNFTWQQSHLVNTSVKYGILPAIILNVSPFSSPMSKYNITEKSLHLYSRSGCVMWIVLYIVTK